MDIELIVSIVCALFLTGLAWSVVLVIEGYLSEAGKVLVLTVGMSVVPATLIWTLLAEDAPLGWAVACTFMAVAGIAAVAALLLRRGDKAGWYVLLSTPVS
jgi:hypothetical protein